MEVSLNKRVNRTPKKEQGDEKKLIWIDKVKLKVHFKLVELQSMHKDCVDYENTPKLFCEPYIYFGYRPINRPYSYYLKSLFYKHNETFNAWSHYIGAIYTIYLSLINDYNDPYSWPILANLITATIMFFTSATAHLMHSKSDSCHMTCFLCDYGGVTFNYFGCAFMQLYTSTPIWYYSIIEPYLLPLLGSSCTLCFLSSTIAQTIFTRPYPPMKRIVQFWPCVFLYLFIQLPLLLALTASESPQMIRIDVVNHIWHVVFFLLGVFLFVFDLPQRIFPGKLDFIGQGHNLFHILIFAATVFQQNACNADFIANRDIIASNREPPTFEFCFFWIFAIIFYYALVTYEFKKMLAHNFNSEGNFKKESKIMFELY